jgi:hypothetical protein
MTTVKAISDVMVRPKATNVRNMIDNIRGHVAAKIN